MPRTSVHSSTIPTISSETFPSPRDVGATRGLLCIFPPPKHQRSLHVFPPCHDECAFRRSRINYYALLYPVAGVTQSVRMNEYMVSDLRS